MPSYIYPITRYSELTTTIVLDTFTDKRKEVMAFYQRDVTSEDYKRINYCNGEISDAFQYVKDNLLLRDPVRGPCKYYELMKVGLRYEGLTDVTDIGNFGECYEVNLGS
ncbi:Hypothetical protein HVR_LOCUS828 [uncultured virus]|nr:Hypothetical protein HVR_LOCUS828 [uncultured virus]